MAAKIRHRVRALDKRPPWCIPLPESATVAELARAVEVRENHLLPEEEAPVSVGIQLEYRDELCAVSAIDLLVDHVPVDSKDAIFVAVRNSGGPSASSLISREEAPSSAPTGPETFRLQPYVSPSSTTVVSPAFSPVRSSHESSAEGPKSSNVGAASAGVDEAVASGTKGGTGELASASNTSSSSDSCDACNTVFIIATPTFCCRICRKLFHSECAGYNTSTKRQSPPPDWICPRCPNGERGPSETVHRCLKEKGVVTQPRGNQPFCPICLGDNRVPGTSTMGRSIKCRGCGLHTHVHCLEKVEIGPDGRWSCDECQRRRDGVIPGNNPTWRWLKEARLDGGWGVSTVLDAAAAPAVAATAAVVAATVEGTGAAAAASLDPNPTKDLGHLQPSGNSAERSTRRRSTPGRRSSGDSTTSCCKKSVTPKRAVFSCRVCRKLFHGQCAGYNHTKRQVPPPDWICPNCPNGERGPSKKVDPSLKGKGVVNQKRGNMPWCPICLLDNRKSGERVLGNIERCPGCGLHTHAHCLAGLQVYDDGSWPCDECDRRRHGVVPGDNPVWKWLKAARRDGGLAPTWTHPWAQLPPSLGAADVTPPAAPPSESPISDVAGSLEGATPSSSTARSEAETAAVGCKPTKDRPPLFHQSDHIQNQPSHSTGPDCHGITAKGRMGWILPAAAAGAATERAADTTAGGGEPTEDAPPILRDQDHAQDQHSRSTAPGSHEIVATGRVVGAPSAAAAGEATERAAFYNRPAGSPLYGQVPFWNGCAPSSAVEMAVRAAVEAVAGVASAGAPASSDPRHGPASSSAEVLAAITAAPPSESAGAVGHQSVGSPGFGQVWFMGGSPLRSEDSAEAPAALAATPAAKPATPAGVEGYPVEEVGGTEPEQTIYTPPRTEESSRGVTDDESDNAHVPANSSGGGSNCCEACNKVFIPSLRPSFCCRTCRKLFHGDCAGYARHKRQCPPPDWICPRCPNGERGPTEYDTHTSLKGKGSVHQKLGNQLWCPMCFGDDRAHGSANNGPGKKCPDCGLRTHAHCMSGLEIGPGGRWPCDECQRRRDGVTPGNNSLWLRLKAARLDGGPTVATTGAPLSPLGATTITAASSASPTSSGDPSGCSATRSADAGPAEAAGAACPLATNASLLFVAPLDGGLQTPSTSLLPSEATASTPSTSKASATSMDSSQAFLSSGAPTPSTAAATPATPSTCPLSPASFSCQPAQSLDLSASPSAFSTSESTGSPGSPSSPASSSGGAMQDSAPTSSNAEATPSRVDTVEDGDVLISGDISSDDGAAGASSPPHPVSGPVPNQGTPVGSSSLATAVPSLPVPLELATAPVARAVSSGNDGANKNWVECSDGSNHDRATETVSQPASKKPRLADSSLRQLLPRCAIQSKGQAAETIAVAAAQLLGGMPEQQREAEVFVETELANHNMDLRNQLLVRLKRTVEVNEGGVWVNRRAVADLCGTSKTPADFPCVVRYVVGTGCKKPKESRREARSCFSLVLTRAKGSDGAFEAYNVGGECMLRWKGRTSP